MLETIVIEPKKSVDGCVIWLHGLGADGHDFESVVPALGLPDNHGIRFVFPHAPYRPITLNQHQKMRGWYDIYTLNNLEQEDEAGIQASCDALHTLIQQQDLENNRIVLAGFSQGGAIALLHGMRASDPFAGILGLSTYLPFLRHTNKRPTMVAHNASSILLCHGTHDDIIPLRLGEATRDYVMTQNQQTNWETYPMGHQVCQNEINDIGKWLTQQFPEL